MPVHTRLLAALIPIAAIACTHQELTTVERTLDAGTATLLEVAHREGSLEVVGEPGRSTIDLEVTLVRYAPAWGAADDRAADELEIQLEARSDRLFASAWVDREGGPYAADMVLRVPADLDVLVDDGSGDTFISDVASLDLSDGSGSLTVFDVPGPVYIEDGSGDLVLEGVGPTRIVDDSGSIVVQGVLGDLDIDDESGDIRVDDVSGTVTIRDGSGSIHVHDVGDLVVLEDTSGDLYD